jgi:hypothetical protein
VIHAYADEDTPDRDTWTSPPLIADMIGPVWLDPCSNERSIIQAVKTFDLARGQDGLALSRYVNRYDPKTAHAIPRDAPGGLVFLNPPYSRGNVPRWVDAYLHTRFCFLLRVDTSTAWWSTLWRRVELVCVPTVRVNFTPPPGVEPHHATSNPFPHALLLRRAEDATPMMLEQCYVMTPKRKDDR